MVLVRTSATWEVGLGWVPLPEGGTPVTTIASIPSHIIQDLKDHIASLDPGTPEGFVFRSPEGESLRRSNFNRRFWRPACEAAGLTHLRFHDLRHTGNTLAASTGASTQELMARMGHASP